MSAADKLFEFPAACGPELLVVKIADPSRQCGDEPPSIDRTVESVKRDG
ncbi:hypothetical protein HL667_03680 [Bradyrhizobium sp. 83012]|uniref:Uncharacterized protein n=1 Tax=Bradyrhizobium aeschynomenes TaxID=2734909 RepID=A0ABX2C757_9BRAD|nr:hypothetical protein [Bradyrhizobium aeschynomenes]NPU15020.1 hypothetical protein [Bradyrhizobium aeschynomenes]NPU64091.1 hypothetical protein [Bradyrhizobium aeschynomenes]